MPINTQRVFSILMFFIVLYLVSCENNIRTEEDIKQNLDENQIEDWYITKHDIDISINYRDMKFVNNEVGFIIGYNGKIAKTINGGTTWGMQNSGTTLHLFSVFFLNENFGYVAGQGMSGCLDDDCDKGNILLKTSDGGINWTKLYIEENNLRSLIFFNENNGIAIKHYPSKPQNYIVKTTDGGEKWQEVLEVSNNYGLGLLFPTDLIGYTMGKNGIIKTSDGGNNWQNIFIPESNKEIYKLYFFDKIMGLASDNRNILRTQNGGNTWESLDLPFSSFSIIHFEDANHGFVINRESEYEGGDFPVFKGSIIYYTDDGGNSWKESELINTLNLGITFFPSHNLGYSYTRDYFYILQKE